ncbi:hypothetical protein ACO2Q3_12520 [Caulobacter sp. KR2-114]|uniref:hypothetical protein n=1 Tax=Caulobacter sp. KR2-114 TaxID=3400912 RepID=UPI003C0477B6
MAASTVFMIDQANGLTELSPSAYDSEDLFQALLADHPALLQSAGGPTGKLILVRREAPVPEAQDGPGRWSLDHLFLDGDGVPVLVEVKRATDTRARREVVAQMLDYAANGVAYWPVDQIIEAFEATARKGGAEPEQKLAEFLGDVSPESYWRQVDANLRSGRVRMVFVADQIGSELRRIVEFLNEQMRPAEVLAIEVAQFTAEGGVRLLTPKLIGATERAVSAKAVTPAKPPIDEAGWLESLKEAKGVACADHAARLLEWFRAHGFVTGITDSQDAMFARLVKPGGKPIWPFFIRRSSGKVETSLQYLKENPAFASDAQRLELLERIRALPGVSISTTKATGWPAIPLADLSQAAIWDGFTAIATDVKARSDSGV